MLLLIVSLPDANYDVLLLLLAMADVVRLSMDKDVHPRYACQLETRTWYITDDNGEVETVKGPGVIGKCGQ